MIQRIQTLYLALTTFIAVLMIFMPVATLWVPNEASYEFYTTQVMQVSEPPIHIAYNWMSLILNAILILLPIVTIFVYKKRFLQMRLCVVNIVLLLGMLVLMWVQISHMIGEIDADRQIRVAFGFPLIGIVLTWLALRGIIRDITLLKSYDRIR